MNVTLENWRDSLLDAGSVRLSRTVEASGATRLIGSRPAYAKVAIKFEPADDFQVATTVSGNDPRILSYMQAVALGALDVLMTTRAYAISGVRITVTAIDDDEVTSTPRAFRLAAREATRKALAEVDENALT